MSLQNWAGHTAIKTGGAARTVSRGAQVPFSAGLGDLAEYAAMAGHITRNSMLSGETIRFDGALGMAPR